MSLTLPPLPYALDALEPHISRRRCRSITAAITPPTSRRRAN